MKERGIGPSHLLIVVAAIATALFAGAWYAQGGRSVESTQGIEPMSAPPTSTLTIHVSGAVHASGLVSLDEGARVADAVAAAGGVLTVADLTNLNLAAAVMDGDHIVVPFVGAEAHVGSESASRVDLNRATATELESLPGVGPVLAERIVTHRQETGRFQTVEDLLDVPGIGEAKLTQLRDQVIIR